ncbi:polyphosphate kinase 2 [Agaricicola taiwanensis]|uniref:ADP/GDP-polyphosphate phosphotransferase n=1 Tax=Agaricicola taiwanensis TaxID=591372 RepID=A0A8J2VPZ4_9RHOB|nr:polyphosphate kinase 2 [Agaricicola taiwanensis]GGE35247.1 polyphosphate kinase 2 [Agaricicola taiwanensis]
MAQKSDSIQDSVHDTSGIEVVVDGAAVDLDAQPLPKAIEKRAFRSGGFPYPAMKRKPYEKELRRLQIDLLKLQAQLHSSGRRLVVVFEGRDSAGKGGTISRFTQHLNPRSARVVALPKPSDVERGQWYFQRYVSHLPTSGEIVLFDRSWYNRAVVEPVMGFCKPADTRRFFHEAPRFEAMLIESGIILIKFWLTVGREMQLTRLHARRHDPLKQWKLSPIDYAGLPKWEAYTEAAEAMFDATHTAEAPWTVVRANDKRRLRIACLRHVLTVAGQAPFDGKAPDPKIAFDAAAYRAAGHTP